MHPSTRRLWPLLLTVVSLAACAGAGPSPSPTPEPTPPEEAQVLLRVTQVQALPPRTTFAWTPTIVITLDGRVLVGGAVPAVYPGPLLGPIVERQLSPAGWAAIVNEARRAGLLTGARDFTGGGIPPGGVTARLQITADGKVFDLIGDPSRIMMCITTPCDPAPGSPEAFGGFLVRLVDLGSWLAGQLGPERAHVPAGFAILVGAAPAEEPGLSGPPAAWPLAAGLAAFGAPLADGSGDRCGTVVGPDAATLWPHLQAATSITRWSDPADGSLHGLLVHPLLPGDGDPCEGLVAR